MAIFSLLFFFVVFLEPLVNSIWFVDPNFQVPGKSSMASVSNLRVTEEFINFPSKADHFNKTLEKRPRVIRDLQDYSPLILITETLQKQKKKLN